MPKSAPITFTFQEIAALLAKSAGVTHGDWGLLVRFGIAAANVPTAEGNMVPAAVVPVLEIGIQQFEEPSNLTVDASTLGDAPTKAKRKKRSASDK